MRIRRHAAVLVAPAVLLLPAAPAFGAGGIDVDIPGGVLTFERLAPGYGGSAEVRISNGSEHDAEVMLRVTDVVDDENGCIRQEVNGGDATCDAGGGELSTWLRVAVDRDGERLGEGPMRLLECEGAIVAEAMPAGSDVPLAVSVTLPYEAGNDTMTDRVGFALRIDAAAETDEDTEILGVEATAGGGGGDRGDREGVGGVSELLPSTGGSVLG